HRTERLREIVPQRVDDLDVAAEVLELGGGVLAERLHDGIDARVAEVRTPGDVQAADVARARVEVRAALARQRDGIAIVAAREAAEHHAGDAPRARERTAVRHVIPPGERRDLRHAAVRRLEPDESAERRGQADRAAAVAAEADGSEAARDRGGRAAAR